MYKRAGNDVLVLLVHPGGPFWARKDAGAWSIPKGEFEGEDALAAARREFEEETGVKIDGEPAALTPCTQKGGKVIFAFAIAGEVDTRTVRSNTFEMEWPPRSGRMQEFPEIDRADWFSFAVAEEKINPAQRALLAELKAMLGAS